MIAALYVETDGTYTQLPQVEAWDIGRDARKYEGPWPVVAHPPCQRWGRFWHGSTRKPHQFKMGDDGGCFEAALTAVRRWGGVLEHPAHSNAWKAFALNAPTTIWRVDTSGLLRRLDLLRGAGILRPLFQEADLALCCCE